MTSYLKHCGCQSFTGGKKLPNPSWWQEKNKIKMVISQQCNITSGKTAHLNHRVFTIPRQDLHAISLLSYIPFKDYILVNPRIADIVRLYGRKGMSTVFPCWETPLDLWKVPQEVHWYPATTTLGSPENIQIGLLRRKPPSSALQHEWSESVESLGDI